MGGGDRKKFGKDGKGRGGTTQCRRGWGKNKKSKRRVRFCVEKNRVSRVERGRERENVHSSSSSSAGAAALGAALRVASYSALAVS